MATVEGRCDRCGHRAYVEVIFHGGRALYFCAHHANSCKVRDLPDVIVIDATEQLTAKG